MQIIRVKRAIRRCWGLLVSRQNITKSLTLVLVVFRTTFTWTIAERLSVFLQILITLLTMMNAFNSFQMDFFVLSQLWTDGGSFFAFWFHAGSIQPIDVVLNYIWYRLVEQARLSRSALYLTFYFYHFPQLFPLDRHSFAESHEN